MSVEFNDQGTTATISLDKHVYSKSAVLRACYWFSKDLHFQIDDKKDVLQISVKPRVVAPTLNQPKIKALDEWIPEIFDALLDSQLRVEIQTETAGVRELIIAKAFAESGILEDPPPGTFEDPVTLGKGESNKLIKINSKPPE
jgi:His-Xaa-Ser system protein HxsD